jgi:hypothetical protein
MKMSDDSSYAEQATTCEQTGLPLDRFGNWLVPPEEDAGLSRKELQLFNSPYGHLFYAIGDGDDFVCFDFFIADTSTGKWFGIDAVVNSETGSFIDGFGRALVKLDPENRTQTIDLVVSEILTLIDSALDWLIEGGDESGCLEHGTEGWNQDPYFVLRDAVCCVASSIGLAVPDAEFEKYSDRTAALRFGTPGLNMACGIGFLNGEDKAKCPHGEVLGECYTCDAAGDRAFDCAREDRFFGK